MAEQSDGTEVGEVVEIQRDGVLEPAAEVVQTTCPVCGEEFIGTKREAGGFLSGHEVYHRHEMAMAVVVDEMGGA